MLNSRLLSLFLDIKILSKLLPSVPNKKVLYFFFLLLINKLAASENINLFLLFL